MEFSVATDTGKKRSNNEDFLFASDKATGPFPNFFAVADGMGGHNAGEIASELAIKTLIEELRQSDGLGASEAVLYAIDRANARVYSSARSDSEKEGMGTTLVTCSVYENRILASSVGDSRLYTFKDNSLKQITHDHTVVGEMLRMGTISKIAAATHPKRHMLTRAVGVGGRVQADIFEIPIEEADAILLATDGLTNMLSDEDITKVLSKDCDTETKVSILVDAANTMGGEDNITIILIDLKR